MGSLVDYSVEQSKEWSYGNQRQAALLGYMAGIIDGEGCLMIKRNKGIGQYHAMVMVGMVEKQAIKLLQETFGGNIREERVPNKRSIYRWTLGKREEVARFMEIMEPWLFIKQPQLQLVKAWLAVKLRERADTGRKLTEEELQHREQFYLKMKKLNAVGAAATTNRDDTREGEVIV